MLAGTLSGIEMGLDIARVPHRKGGVAGSADIDGVAQGGNFTVRSVQQ